jgi:hypothetical protein
VVEYRLDLRLDCVLQVTDSFDGRMSTGKASASSRPRIQQASEISAFMSVGECSGAC